MPKLKPCPFCGNDVEIRDYTDRVYGFWDYKIVCICGLQFESPSTAKVEFTSTGIKQTRNAETKRKAYEQLIEAWNKRA